MQVWLNLLGRLQFRTGSQVLQPNKNLQRLADTLGQRPLTPLGDVGVAGGFRV